MNQSAISCASQGALSECIINASKGSNTVTFMSGETADKLTWAELHRAALSLAVSLNKQGFRHGDRIALLGNTSKDFVTAMQATWLIGATVVVLPLPFRLSSMDQFKSDSIDRVNDAEVAGVIVDRTLAAFIQPKELKKQTGAKLILLSELASENRDIAKFKKPNYQPDDLAILQFTSGSTSAPKGVMLSNSNICANLDAISTGANTNRTSDVIVSWLPLYHDMGLIGCLVNSMANGLDLVIGAPNDFLSSPLRWMMWISDFSGTATAGPNFSYALAARALKKSKVILDLSKLRIALNGAEPVDPKTVANFVEAGARHGLRPEAVFPAFGMAEVCIAGAFPEPMTGLRTDKISTKLFEEQGLASLADSEEFSEFAILGGPVEGLEFRIQDPQSGDVLAERKVGELQIRGTSLTTGYFKKEKETAASFIDGWFKTGDLAYLTDGELVLCGRIKDLIIIGGRNIYPQDIEKVVGEIPDVRTGNVIAFGTKANIKESIVVVAETKIKSGFAELVTQIKSSVLATVGVPASTVTLVSPSSLPKTSSGKLQRAKCKASFESGSLTSLN